MTDPARCSSCGNQADAASGPDVPPGEGQPRAGDLAVCFYCAAIHVYLGHGTQLRNPSDAELAAALADPQVRRYRAAIRRRRRLRSL